jgi:ABC-type Fe3+-siderophore transport system permease subunit
MNKPLYGLLLGAVLGALDGLTAWFTPEVRPQIIGIVIGSTFKGVIAGVCIGWFAKKVKSLPLGILFGLAVGMFLAYLIAAMPQPSGRHYYFEIMLPGSLVGAIVGYATQKHSSPVMPSG